MEVSSMLIWTILLVSVLAAARKLAHLHEAIASRGHNKNVEGPWVQTVKMWSLFCDRVLGPGSVNNLSHGHDFEDRFLGTKCVPRGSPWELHFSVPRPDFF